jgi:hypothetical protein
MDDQKIKDFLTQAINASYKDLTLTNYELNLNEEKYLLDLLHTKTERNIRIGFHDSARKRDFDIIPIQSHNAPLGLIQIFTTFITVLWHAEENNQTIEESLLALATDELKDLYDYEEEKLVQ